MRKTAKFNIGDVVIHTRQGYRAIVVDVDPLFQASGRYNPQAPLRAFSKRNPWYRLLVDESSLMTYVEESLLKFDSDPRPIKNPNIIGYLKNESGTYTSISPMH